MKKLSKKIRQFSLSSESAFLIDTLYTASLKGDFDTLCQLLSPKHPQHKIVMTLLNSAHDKTDATPLFRAVLNGHADCVKLLLEAGARYETYSNGRTPLWVAAQKGHTEVLRLLLDNNMNPSYRRVMALLNRAHDKTGATALYQAAQNGHTDCVELLLEAGAEYNSRGNGCTPLIIAAQHGHTHVVRLFLNLKKNPHFRTVMALLNNAHDKTGATALYLAAQNGHTDCVELLLRAGARYEVRPDGCTPLWAAAQNGHTSVVRLLLDFNNNLQYDKVMALINSAWDKTGATALYQAAQNGHTDCVELLLDTGSGYEANPDGRTPLWAAVQDGHTNVVRLLLDRTKNPNYGRVMALLNTVHDETGATALHQAAQSGYTDCVELLLEAGARYMACLDGITPLFLAAQNGHADVVRLLLDRNKNPKYGRVMALLNKVHNESGASVLHQAALSGHTDCIQLLLEAGASNRPNNENLTPAQIAEINHFYAIRDIILSNEKYYIPHKNNFDARLAAINVRYEDIPDLYIDPIMYVVMNNPVSLPSGHTYDAKTIEKIMGPSKKFRDPQSRRQIDRSIVLQCEQNWPLTKAIETYVVQMEKLDRMKQIDSAHDNHEEKKECSASSKKHSPLLFWLGHNQTEKSHTNPMNDFSDNRMRRI